MDVRTLPQPVSIYETMGRGAGWLAAASVLARTDGHDAPHLVYLPERPFDAGQFLGDLDRVVRRHGWAVVVVPEGLADASGNPVYQTASAFQRDELARPVSGGVAAHLAEVVAARLNIRCRWEKPGLCGRASMHHVSQVDRDDAERVGRAAVRATLASERAQMVALRPRGADGDACALVPLSDVAGERTLPREWLADPETGVAPAFLEYARPIVGDLIDYPVPLKDQLAASKPLQRQPV
jgi:6-phosphofructokinase 1